MNVFRAAAVAAAVLAIAGTNGFAETIRVDEGGDLQAALNRARPGDVIELQAGATFTGSFSLPRKDGGDAFITVRTAGDSDSSGRVTPDQAAGFAKLRATDAAALQTAPGAHHWRIERVEIVGAGAHDLVMLGDGSNAQDAADKIPHDLVIDRSFVHGDPARGVRRCIALNSASTVISNSYVADCKAAGVDAQAIAGWNGPGPFSILNNYLEGSTENVMFGGADPSIPNLVPADIVIRGNLISKPVAWRQQHWQVKNLLELKNARNVTIEQNVLENNWQAAQTGFAVLFTVRNQDGHCNWCTVENVRFAGNLVRHSGAGVQILGVDNHGTSGQTQKITIADNVFDDIDPKTWGGNGYGFQITGGPRDLVIDHNTVVQDNASGIVQLDGRPVTGFVLTNNILRIGAYGIIGTDHAPGEDTIRAFLPGATIARNVFADGDSSRYPSKNLFPSSDDLRKQFVSFTEGDYHLKPNSRWRNAGVDGRDLGAIAPPGNFDPLLARNPNASRATQPATTQLAPALLPPRRN